MTWTVSTIVSEIFYCIIGLFFISNGVKALKDPDCSKKHTTALFWFILAFTFIVGAHLPRWITGACVVLMAALTALRLVAPSKSTASRGNPESSRQDRLRRIHSAAYPGSYRGAGRNLLKGTRRQ